MKIDPRDFLLNTDYEMDKIVYFTSGEISPGETISIPNNLSFTPLVFGVCAFNEDFSDPKISPYQESIDSGTILLQFYARNGEIVVRYQNDRSSSEKMYYRIYAFEPTGSSSNAPYTSSKAKKVILNTDYNYCKLYKKGVTDSDLAITHNFGYIPFVLAWREGGGTCMPQWFSDNDLGYVEVTNTTVYLKSGNDKLHYRIYYDEVES